MIDFLREINSHKVVKLNLSKIFSHTTSSAFEDKVATAEAIRVHNTCVKMYRSCMECIQMHASLTIKYKMIQYKIIQYNMIQYNMIHYNIIQYNMIQYNTIQYDKKRYNTIKQTKIQYNTIQYNTIQYTTIQYKYEYHYCGINPVEFRDHIFSCLRIVLAKFRSIIKIIKKIK